jgi:hypothetical protein
VKQNAFERAGDSNVMTIDTCWVFEWIDGSNAIVIRICYSFEG